MAIVVEPNAEAAASGFKEGDGPELYRALLASQFGDSVKRHRPLAIALQLSD